MAGFVKNNRELKRAAAPNTQKFLDDAFNNKLYSDRYGKVNKNTENFRRDREKQTRLRLGGEAPASKLVKKPIGDSK